MPDSPPPLRPLHADASLFPLKLAQYGRLSTDEIVESLLPGRVGSLKTRPDGTMVDGHHRVKILRDRGYNVDGLPREIVERDLLPDPADRPPPETIP
jgi:hypothetical protein